MTARKTLFVILGILMILAGITCFFTPVETSSVIPFIFGLAMVIDGIGRIIAWFSIREYAPQSGWVFASSVISLIFGLMLTTSPMLQMSVGVFVVLLTGWWILADSGPWYHPNRPRFSFAQDQERIRRVWLR